jgi:hypothetical protein
MSPVGWTETSNPLPSMSLLLGLEVCAIMPCVYNGFFFLFCSSQDLYLEPHPPAHFCDGFFQDRASQTTFLGRLWAVILLISASWPAKIKAWATVSSPQKKPSPSVEHKIIGNLLVSLYLQIGLKCGSILFSDNYIIHLSTTLII